MEFLGIEHPLPLVHALLAASYSSALSASQLSHIHVTETIGP